MGQVIGCTLFTLLIINDVSLRMFCGISELLSIVWFMSAVAMSIADVRIAAPKKIVAFISLFLSFFLCVHLCSLFSSFFSAMRKMMTMSKTMICKMVMYIVVEFLISSAKVEKCVKRCKKSVGQGCDKALRHAMVTLF